MNWADTPLFVYAAVQSHPARDVVERLFREGEWGAPALVLTECYQVLTTTYGVAHPEAVSAIERALSSPIRWTSFETDRVKDVVRLRGRHDLQTADALLLLLAREDGGTLVTQDKRLLRVAQDQGMRVRNPITPEMERTIAQWEDRHLPPKGLPRLLRIVERWLREHEPPVADQFREATGGLSRLR
ncbi:MAG TPA: PIN domain-containing protein [Chloroflexota bacterium]|nr:PIN domain-containing protein [Chloroflexota bacterium]